MARALLQGAQEFAQRRGEAQNYSLENKWDGLPTAGKPRDLTHLLPPYRAGGKVT